MAETLAVPTLVVGEHSWSIFTVSDFISAPSFPPYQPIKPKRPWAKAKLCRSVNRATIQTFRYDTLKHAPKILWLWLWFVGIHAAFGCFARLPASPPPPTRLVPINSELRWRLAGASSGFAKWRGCMVHVSGGSIWRARCFRAEREYMARANQMIFTPHLFVTFRRNSLMDLLHALTSLKRQIKKKFLGEFI